MLPHLITHIKKFIPLTDDEVEVVLKYATLKEVTKKEYLLKEGQVCKGNYFVEQGCLRMFYINDKGVEQTTQFALEGWWLADYMSLPMQQSAHFSIQAVEASQVCVIDHAVQEQLLAEVPKMERYFRLMMQRAYAAYQFRLKYAYEFSKEESYLHFVNHFPGFVQRIPQYMLASYLGFTPEYLSEIRKKLSGNSIS